MDAKAQVNALRRFVPGVDFVAIAKENEQDRQARTETNRKAKDAATRANAISVPADLPASKIDEQALLDQITGAAQGNAEIETRRARRAEFAANVERMREHVARRRERIEELRLEIETITHEVDALDKRINDDAAHIVEAPPLPDPVDISAVSTALTEARRINGLIDQRNTRDAFCVKRHSTSSPARATPMPSKTARAESAPPSPRPTCQWQAWASPTTG